MILTDNKINSVNYHETFSTIKLNENNGKCGERWNDAGRFAVHYEQTIEFVNYYLYFISVTLSLLDHFLFSQCLFRLILSCSWCPVDSLFWLENSHSQPAAWWKLVEQSWWNLLGDIFSLMPKPVFERVLCWQLSSAGPTPVKT